MKLNTYFTRVTKMESEVHCSHPFCLGLAFKRNYTNAKTKILLEVAFISLGQISQYILDVYLLRNR